MSFLNEIERGHLRIEAMSLHVVGEELFVPQPARTVEHAQFFIGRILDTDVSPVYQFKDVSRSRTLLEEMATRHLTFEVGAQNLSREFSRLHGTSTRDGAFLIFELRTNEEAVRIYSLIKYDYREAIEQSENEDGQQLLRRIVNAFIDDRKAIQKAALVRVIDGRADELVSAWDRTRPAPQIADYFGMFLDIERARDDGELNRSVVDALRKVFLDSRNLLPNGDVAAALQRAKAVLRDRQHIDEEAVVESVLASAGHPADQDAIQLLTRRTTQKLRSYRLLGIRFPPDRQILRRPPLRKIRTTEGVTVTYPDEINTVTVRRDRNPDGVGEVITIVTDRVVEDTIVPDRAR